MKISKSKQHHPVTRHRNADVNAKRFSIPESKVRKELEKEVVRGAKKALKEYGRVFERLAKFDRASN